MNNQNVKELELEHRLTKLESKLTNIELKLDIIINNLQKNTNNCEKMSKHIDFVETVYENVKNPLGFICNKVNSFVTGGNHDLETKKLKN